MFLLNLECETKRKKTELLNFVIECTDDLLNDCSQCVGAGGSDRSCCGGFRHGVCGSIKHHQISGSALSRGMVSDSYRHQLCYRSLRQIADRSLGR